MQWEKIENTKINPSAHYLVKTNGALWHDFDLMVLIGHLVIARSEKEYVRGRPVWVALITEPEEAKQ